MTDVHRGHLVYLSEAKLLNEGRRLRLKTSWPPELRSTTKTARMSLEPVPGMGGSIGGVWAEERFNPLAAAEARESLLDDVLATIGPGLVDLETTPGAIRPWCWFRFRRSMRIGLGANDSNRSMRGVVLVDERSADGDDRAGLMMIGSPTHLVHPFAPADKDDLPGARSGSGTGRYFEWMVAYDRALDVDASALVPFDDEPNWAHRLSYGNETFGSMYRLFARSEWFGAAILARSAPCEGVGIGYHVVRDSDRWIVLGSPLYLRLDTGVEQGESRVNRRRWSVRRRWWSLPRRAG
jgi:hypothetical protein